MSWDNLSFREKAEYIKTGVRNGLSDIRDIKDAYNSFALGGNIHKDQYQNWVKAMNDYRKQDINNDSTYDTKSFYNENPARAWAMLNDDPDAHYTDKYKTVYHPTASDESIYSGNKNNFNPKGLKFGHWTENENGSWNYVLSNDLVKHSPVSMQDRIEYVSYNEPNGLRITDERGRLPIVEGIPFGGVLPTLTIKGKKTARKNAFGGHLFQGGGIINNTDNTEKPEEYYEGYEMRADDPEAVRIRVDNNTYTDENERIKDLDLYWKYRREGLYQSTHPTKPSIDISNRTPDPTMSYLSSIMPRPKNTSSLDRATKAVRKAMTSPTELVTSLKNLKPALEKTKEEQNEQIRDSKEVAEQFLDAVEKLSAWYTLGSGLGRLSVVDKLGSNFASKYRTLFNERGEKIASMIGAGTDGIQLLGNIVNDHTPTFDAIDNSVGLGMNALGFLGDTNRFRNIRIYGRYGNTIDKILDGAGYIQAGWDALIRPTLKSLNIVD